MLCAGGRQQLSGRMPSIISRTEEMPFVPCVPDTSCYGVPASVVQGHCIREFEGRKMVQTFDLDGEELGLEASQSKARFRVQTTQEALKIMTMAILLEERYLLYDRETLNAVRHLSLAPTHIFSLMPGVLLVGNTGIRMDGHPSLVVKAVLSAPDEQHGRPLRFGFEVVSSTLGLLGGRAALWRSSDRTKQNAQREPRPPPLPAYARRHVFSTLPLTVCYGLDCLRPLTDAELNLIPTTALQYSRDTAYSCHNSYRPRVATFLPCAPGLTCDMGSIATLDVTGLFIDIPSETEEEQSLVAVNEGPEAADKPTSAARVPNCFSNAAQCVLLLVPGVLFILRLPPSSFALRTLC